MKIVGKLIGNFVGLMLRDVYTLFYFHEGLMLNLMNRLTIYLLPGIFFCSKMLDICLNHIPDGWNCLGEKICWAIN